MERVGGGLQGWVNCKGGISSHPLYTTSTHHVSTHSLYTSPLYPPSLHTTSTHTHTLPPLTQLVLIPMTHQLQLQHHTSWCRLQTAFMDAPWEHSCSHTRYMHLFIHTLACIHIMSIHTHTYVHTHMHAYRCVCFFVVDFCHQQTALATSPPPPPSPIHPIPHTSRPLHSNPPHLPPTNPPTGPVQNPLCPHATRSHHGPLSRP